MSEHEKRSIRVDDGGGRILFKTVEYPKNSHVSKTTPKEIKKVEKIIKGNVVKKKKSLYRKLVEDFFGEDIENVGEYLYYDVLIPAAKNTFNDMIRSGVEMILFGERQSDKMYRDRGRSFVSYSSYYKGDREQRSDRRDFSRVNRVKHDCEDIILESRGEAEEVLSHLVDLTVDYGVASVADLYDLVGITSNFTDNKYGWSDLRNATITRTRGGYLINLPKTKVIE